MSVFQQSHCLSCAGFGRRIFGAFLERVRMRVKERRRQKAVAEMVAGRAAAAAGAPAERLLWARRLLAQEGLARAGCPVCAARPAVGASGTDLAPGLGAVLTRTILAQSGCPAAIAARRRGRKGFAQPKLVALLRCESPSCQ